VALGKGAGVVMVGGMKRVVAALILGFASVAAPVRAEFDLRRLPTAQDIQAIRQMGWSAAADDLEAKLASAWKPTHAAQAGSSGNALFRQWQRLYQWCRLLGTPEPELRLAHPRPGRVRWPSGPPTYRRTNSAAKIAICCVA